MQSSDCFILPAVLLLQKLDQVGLLKAASGEATEQRLLLIYSRLLLEKQLSGT